MSYSHRLRLPLLRPWHVGVVAFLFTWTLTTHGKFSVSGDEPHYLIITQSLIADGDLDLANNYANNDARLFGHADLTDDGHTVVTPAGATQSKHDIGLPVLLLPIYGAAEVIAQWIPEAWLSYFQLNQGLFAYALISLALNALTACGMALLAQALGAGADSRASWLVLLVAISPPVVSHAFLVFPETIALFVTALVVWAARKVRPDEQARYRLHMVLFCLGVLPWLHRKYSIYVFALAWLLLFLRREVVTRWSSARRVLAAALFLLPHAVFYLVSLSVWGSVLGPQAHDESPFSAHALIAGVPGLLVDRQSGLLTFAPLYLPIAAAWALTWKRTWPYLIPFLALYFPLAAYREWWAGFSPAARYLAPTVPLMLVVLASAIEWRGMRTVVAMLAVPQLVIDAVVWQCPGWLWPQYSSHNQLLEALWIPGRLFEAMLPLLQRPATPGPLPLFTVFVFTAASLIVGRVLWQNESRPFADGPQELGGRTSDVRRAN